MSNEFERQPLSPHGAERREAMLSQLVSVVHATRRRRRLRNGAVLVATAAVAFGLALHAVRVGDVGSAGPDRFAARDSSGRHRVEVVGDGAPHVTQFVATDFAVVDRLRADRSRLVVWLDDAGLLEALASAQRPAGLVRFESYAWLTDPVTDDELFGQR
jgi:hypothetical protein